MAGIDQFDTKAKMKRIYQRRNPGMEKLDPGAYLFVSYAHANADEAIETLDILDKNRYAYWYDTGIKSGESWTKEISSRIKNCGQFLLLMSNEAKNSSNVVDEIYFAKKAGKPFIIVYLDDVSLSEELELMIGRMHGIKRTLFIDPADYELRLCDDLMPELKLEHCAVAQENVRKYDSISARLSEKYENLREISDKKTRKTFEGTNRTTKLPVFIKQYIVSDDAPENILLFESEKYALSNCVCQGVPALLDLYEDSSGGFLVESYVQGKRLSECSRLSQLEVLRIGLRLAYSLRCVHRCNLVHCDIKPANVIVSGAGEVYLIDFNSAQNTLKHAQFWSRGTAFFAAPEQYERNYRPDFRTDFYSLGKTLEFVLSSLSAKEPSRRTYTPMNGGTLFGEPLRFETAPVGLSDTNIPTATGSEDDRTVCLFGLDPKPFPSIKAEDIHPRLRKLIDHMTAESVYDRPQNCDELIDEMNKCRLVMELEEALLC